jgi:glycosyltransferase involved in cell wall biosynthesis
VEVKAVAARQGALTVVLELVVAVDGEGRAWTDSAFPYESWATYLDVFDRVRVVCRARRVDHVVPGALRVDGPGVTVHPLPHYQGLGQLLGRGPAVARSLWHEARTADDLLVRLPGPLGTVAAVARRLGRRPYAAYLVGDIHEVLGPGGPGGVIRRPARWFGTWVTRRSMRSASAVAYVTRSVLQDRYPPSTSAYCTWFSDVEIVELEERSIDPVQPARRILSVGSMEQRYKRFDLVLLAFRDARAAGLDLELTIVGSGLHRSEYESLAQSLGVGGEVRFTGQLPGAASVRDEMRRSDLLVLASDTEGLPRVVIEAMSCGLPCVATNVGGTPELLGAEDLVPAGDAPALAGAIMDVMSDTERRQRMSERNLRSASAYLHDAQDDRRRGFLRAVRTAGGAATP